METIHIPLAKRVVDIFLSLLIFILSLPLWLIILLSIFLEHIFMGCSSAALFYREIRYSQGRAFWLIKFNIFNPRIIAEYRQRGKFIHTKDIERLPLALLKTGYLIKQIYIDELPQLLNVVWGDLSLVGPRPVNEEVYKKLIKQGIKTKVVIKAGLTGNFQSQKDNTHKTDKELDQEYIDFCRNHSTWQIVLNDFKIIIKTLFLMIKARGL